ncbi:tripartite tricarboxylate transporter substrate binding protein [Curvibacter sp. HBC61]|uniref:Tripartite tricarboxylate transporter substrate binding protein n=1 Tax=Curvibacter cyanobacteriorum TaxID=3026422 RepID=A0ABT5MV62_9BURK|nr:tripartite tricarboxylate transporter substrate binding protein [Curvibacter sp. HBC61]MDD0837703.1 tripartite tricarboxylate transporter substrate binding protein [Curvibacter sp. HBC61]
MSFAFKAPPNRSALPRRLALGAGLSLWASLTLAPALAQSPSYPSRPIVMVVPQAAGGTNDIVGRLVSQKLGELLGSAGVVVENRPGAGGNIGTQSVAKAPKDGYTLLMTISSSQAINPALYKNVGFDPVKDFRPISLIGAVPNVLLVNPNFQARTVGELLALAKAKPGQLPYASAGNGTLNHLLGEMLNSMAGVDLQHVPYKGVAPAMNDVLGGQLPMLFASLPSSLANIRAGKLRALAVSGPTRSPVLPEVPTLGETVPGYSGTLWIGLFAPAGVPQEVLTRLQDGMSRALLSKDLRDKLEQQGVELAGTPDKAAGPEALATLLQDDLGKWAQIVKSSGASVD